MDNQSLQSIQSKLNEELAQEGRKIVFWYDERKEWVDEIEKIELQNAEVLYSYGNNQFELKYIIEHENPDRNYLIYSPLPKPEPNKDHLLDVFLYSREFKADSLSMFMDELNIAKKHQPLLEKYGFFFRNTNNQEIFKSLDIPNFDEYTIPLGVMCSLCDEHLPKIEHLLVHIIANDEITNNKYINILSTNGIDDVFWEYCRNFLGWQDPSPTLEKMLLTIYVSYFKRDVDFDLPDTLNQFISGKPGNVTQVFELLSSQKRMEYADYAAGLINIKSILNNASIDSIVKCSVFKEVDISIIDWIINRILNNDLKALANRKNLAALCEERLQKHSDDTFERDYGLLHNAVLMLNLTIDDFPVSLDKFIGDYTGYYYKVDYYYRHFIEEYDKLEDNSRYYELYQCIENYYTNSFLAKSISAWNKVYISEQKNTEIKRSRKFYSTFVKPLNKKTVVIICDSLRYETAAELTELFKKDQNCTVNFSYMLGELPSITTLGMAALLPNKNLDISLDGKAACDEKDTGDLQKREAILRSANENTRCIQYNELSEMKKDEVRSLLKNIDILYVYQNQIDSRGENLPTEKDVFAACRDTINRVFEKVKQLGRSANVYHFIVTSDHGFIYKREKLKESEKIADVSKLGTFTNRRFIISDNPVKIDGICSLRIGDLLNNANDNFILFPESVNVFKCSGGQNYVHGGSSPQELIIPVIDIYIEKYAVETRQTEIRLSRAIKPKINNLITTFEFLQTEAVSSEVKPANYEIFLNNDNSQVISDIKTFQADLTGIDSSKRLFKLTFNLKNQEYSGIRKYYLVIYNKDTKMELSRTEVIIDIAFSGSFGFF